MHRLIVLHGEPRLESSIMGNEPMNKSICEEFSVDSSGVTSIGNSVNSAVDVYYMCVFKSVKHGLC